MGPQLEALAKQRTDLHLRVVDVQSWTSPVAQQYGVDHLPWLWLYEDGKLVTQDNGAVIARLNALR